MTAIENLLSSPWALRIGTALLHFLWQGTVIALVLAMVLWTLRRRTPQVRWLASCVALGLMLAAPLATVCLVSPEPQVLEAPTVAYTEPMLTPALSDTVPVPADHGEPDLIPAETVMSPAAMLDSSEPIAQAGWPERVYELVRPALPWAAILWATGVMIVALWHLGGWAQSQRLKRRRTRPVSQAVREATARLGRTLRVSRPVRVLESALARAPMVIGWLRPVVLLPVSTLAGLTPSQLEAVLAHELAHVRRCDCLVRLLQVVAETLLFYHPAVWWVSRRIRTESEYCCDELAADACGNRQAYARAMAALVELQGGVPQLAAAASGGHVLSRIRRLLRLPESEHTVRPGWLAVALAGLVVTGLIVYGCACTPDPPTAKEDERGEAVASDPQDLVGPVLAADPRYDTNDVLRFRLAWPGCNWRLVNLEDLVQRHADGEGKLYWFVRINGKDYRYNGPVDNPGSEGVSYFGWRNLIIGHSDWPPGKYRVQYLARNLPIVRLDEPQKPLVAARIASNEVVFEIVPAKAAPALGNGAVVPAEATPGATLRGTVWDVQPDRTDEWIAVFERAKSEEDYWKLLQEKNARNGPPRRPAPGVTVTVRGAGVTRTGVTDAEGRYEISGLPYGILEVSGEKVVKLPSGEAAQLMTATKRIAIDQKQVKDLQLDPGAVTITGRVTDAEGRPVAGAHVSGELMPWPDVGELWPIDGVSTVTDEDGTYELRAFRPCNIRNIAGYLRYGQMSDMLPDAMGSSVAVRVEAKGFEPAETKVPLVPEAQVGPARRLLRAMNEMAKRMAGESAVAENPNTPLPPSRGHTLTDVNFALKSIPTEPGNDGDDANAKPGGHAPAWGEAVEGVQVRLRAEKKAWPADKVPALTLEARNQGTRTFAMFYAAHVHCHIEVDGQWYGWSEPITVTGPGWPLKPGEQAEQPIEVQLGAKWELNRVQLRLAPGRHTVRVSFRPLRNDEGPVTTAISNAVEIEILPPDPEDYAHFVGRCRGTNAAGEQGEFEILRRGDEFVYRGREGKEHRLEMVPNGLALGVGTPFAVAAVIFRYDPETGRCTAEVYKDSDGRPGEIVPLTRIAAAWGDPVGGVQVRLWADKTQWKAGETPVLFLDVGNLAAPGARPFHMHHKAEVHCRVEVDGRWYVGWGHVELGAVVEELPPGSRTTDPVKVFLNDYWALNEKMKSPAEVVGELPDVGGVSTGRLENSPILELAPGRHTVRVSFRPLRMPREAAPPTAVSNPVEIEIKPAVAPPASSATSSSTPSSAKPTTLDQLIERVKAAERKLLNVHVVGTLSCEGKTAGSDEWKTLQPRLESEAWLNGLRQSKMRFDVVVSVNRWIGGPYDWVQTSYSVGYDGRYGRVARHTSGPVGEPKKVGLGQVFAELPFELQHDGALFECAGAPLSLYLYNNGRDMPLSELFEEGVAKGRQVTVSEERLGGAGCTRVSIATPGKFEQSWWLDPARGYALVQEESAALKEDGAREVRSRREVTALKELSPGVWYPAEACCESYSGDVGVQVARNSVDSGLTAFRSRYKATLVEGNAPRLDDAVFEVNFAEERTIQNMAAGIVHYAQNKATDLMPVKEARLLPKQTDYGRISSDALGRQKETSFRVLIPQEDARFSLPVTLKTSTPGLEAVVAGDSFVEYAKEKTKRRYVECKVTWKDLPAAGPFRAEVQVFFGEAKEQKPLVLTLRGDRVADQ